MSFRKRKQQYQPEPESELLRKVRESNTGQPLISPFISIRPNGSSFPSKIMPFKPVVENQNQQGMEQKVNNMPLMNAPNNINNFQQYLSQSNLSTTSNILPSAPIPSVSQPFKPVFIVSPRKIKEEENAIILPNFANDSTKNEFIQCEMSQLQKDLFEAVDYLMSLSENEQQNLKVQLFNHPFLLFARIQQLAAPFANKASGKRARTQWINYSNVLCKFPTRYESLHQCYIEESGKLRKLFQILVESSCDDDARNPAQLILTSNFPRTLNMIGKLMEQINAKLNYSIYSIVPNMPSTTRQWDLDRAIWDQGRKLILLNTKTENLPNNFFNGTRLIFYDFDKINDEKLLARWNLAGVKRIQRLAILGTFEME